MNGPVLVRERELAQPGLHTHNFKRRALEQEPRPGRRNLFWVRVVLLILGLAGVGYYGYRLADQQIYQGYENWAFNQQIGGRAAVTFADYVRETTPFGFLAGERPAVRSPAQPRSVQPAGGPAPGSILGRVEVGRLNLMAMVREGVDSDTLSRAVGHVPKTALAGQNGNFAIAAHRDTLFRALKDIHKGDLVTFESQAGTYKYEVFAMRIVKPSDISVLRADGGLEPQRHESLLTMITCYPFYYVGSAPKRFIVQAKLLSKG